MFWCCVPFCLRETGIGAVLRAVGTVLVYFGAVLQYTTVFFYTLAAPQNAPIEDAFAEPDEEELLMWELRVF